MDRLLSILKRVEGPQSVIPPTLLYNEGWMLRIVLDALADVPSASSASLPLRVPDDCRWYSEALLPSAFLARSRTDRLAESHTHADAAIGQFDIGRQSKGELALRARATYFAVLEAKMFSALSSGVKNAPYFNQAARNVACVAEVLHRAGAKPEAMEYLAFHVVAPREQIESGLFAESMSKPSIRDCVQRRAQAYEGEKDSWFQDAFLPTLQRISVSAIPWEEIVQALVGNAEDSSEIQAFLTKCLQYNRRESGGEHKRGGHKRGGQVCS